MTPIPYRKTGLSILGETERILDNARALLRQHPAESGCHLKESETRT